MTKPQSAGIDIERPHEPPREVNGMGLVVLNRGTGWTVFSHEVITSQAGPLLGPGRPLNAQHLAQLIDTLQGKLRERYEDELMPATVLSQGPSSVTWYVPGAVRPMHFRLGKRNTMIEVPWPTLIFRVSPKGFRVGALGARSRPKPTARIYQAPLMNCYYDTRICLGSATIPASHRIADLAGFESAIFNTCFSHANDDTLRHGQKISETDEATAAHSKTWKSLVGVSHFPRRLLKSTPWTLEQWIQTH